MKQTTMNSVLAEQAMYVVPHNKAARFDLESKGEEQRSNRKETSHTTERETVDAAS
jgi:hypothetical protein